MIDPLIARSRDRFDLTNPTHQESVLALAEALLAEPDSSAVDEALARPGVPLEAGIAGLLARSRRWLASTDRPVRVGVVFAMWGENHRLLPRTPGNPHGENSLATKLDQLAWATRETPVEWHVYAVDDGCPHDSAEIARRVAGAHPLRDRVTVLELAAALPADEGPLAGLPDADGSRKAGAVMLGAMHAIDNATDAVVYTDADSSVHLGQLGLLLEPFVDRDTPVVLGSRKLPGSVLVKDAARWGPGIKVLRHIQRMVGHAVFSRGIRDSQAAFKLYETGLLARLIEHPTVYDFSFDTDWILAAIRAGAQIEQVPFAFIDSEAESASATQGPMTTWETLLHGLARQVERYGFNQGAAAEMAAVLTDEIPSHRELEQLIDHVPPELENAGEAEYGDPAVMAPDAMRGWVRERLERSPQPE